MIAFLYFIVYCPQVRSTCNKFDRSDYSRLSVRLSSRDTFERPHFQGFGPLEASILAVASAIAWAAASDGKYLPFELHGYLRISWMRKLQ